MAGISKCIEGRLMLKVVNRGVSSSLVHGRCSAVDKARGKTTALVFASSMDKNYEPIRMAWMTFYEIITCEVVNGP